MASIYVNSRSTWLYSELGIAEGQFAIATNGERFL
jgi:hypothetical protein